MYQAVIVDDEPYIVEGINKAIDWAGFHTEICLATTDPVQALDYILSNPVHIVITDVSMPVMNGLQMIQQIKDRKPSIFVIVLSAFDNFEYVRTALRYGAENYLLKPLDPDELANSISQTISHIQERDQLNYTYGRAMLTFRNSFTEQWLKNLLSTNELATKADLLGINLSAPNFTVVIFSCPKSREEWMSRFFDLLLRHLPGHYTGNFFFETPIRLVGVLSPAGDNEENISDFLDRISRAVSASGLQIFITSGSTVDLYSSVYQSYAQADSFAFLEYTSLTSISYATLAGLPEQAAAALNVYEHSQGRDTNALSGLFRHYSPFLCMVHILSKRIGILCKKEYELEDKYKELTDKLQQMPHRDSSLPEFMEYTLSFLKDSDHLMFKVQQSMYPCVDAVIKVVHEFSDKDISLKTLAAKLNVTPSYLGTVFHLQTGYYFNDYLTEARLKYAAKLLEETDMKIKDIADKIGFSSQTYFNRSFKRYFDTSPVNYRRDKKVSTI